MRGKLALGLLVLVVVGAPLTVAILGGGGGRDDDADSSSQQASPERRVYPEGIPDEVQEEAMRDETERRPRGDEARGPASGGTTGPDPAMEGVAYPSQISHAGRAAAVAVRRALGEEVQDGQRTVVGADCRNGTCSIRYRSEPRGAGKVARNQAAILRRLFRHKGVQRVILYVHHQAVGRKKDERAVFSTVTCERSADPRFAWSDIKPEHIARRCTLRRAAGGKLRSRVRRGHVGTDEASRGRGGRGGAGGHAGAGSAAAPGARQSGTAPESVDGTDRAERRARKRRSG